jgi:hypothetical protein
LAVELTRYLDGYHVDYELMKRGLKNGKSGWDLDKSGGKVRLYVRCIGCSKIILVDRRHIYSEGHVGGDRKMTCVDCIRCGTHFWPYLDGWKKMKSPLKLQLIRQWRLGEEYGLHPKKRR